MITSNFGGMHLKKCVSKISNQKVASASAPRHNPSDLNVLDNDPKPFLVGAIFS